ncbi:putative inhibitor of apoptosis [Ruditapes philippinarum]|uniref:putative inhibitor of apoptosis n=1 Tax=Ruditapes philippinarum TaxID=129788 RepID=UPI00295B61AF|nr:putative inhibitor of apoptosis [Ruditapes philippinarum]
MAGVLSKLDKNFNKYRKSYLEETMETNKLSNLSETGFSAKTDCNQHLSDVKTADVKAENNNTSGCRLRNRTKKVRKNTKRNMADSNDVTTERNVPDRDVSNANDDAAERNTSDGILTNTDGLRPERTSLNTDQTDSVDTRTDGQSESNRNREITENNSRQGANGTAQSKESFSDRLGIVIFNPKYRQYATQESRLKSYKNWPKDKKVNVSTLVDAGFAYTGVGDSVRCFYCGGAFKDWSDDSDPWKEHALYFPHCGHIRQCKGVAYIKHICGEGDSDYEIDGDDDDVLIDRVKLVMKRNETAVMAARDFCADESLLRDGVKRILKENKETFSGVDLINATEEIKDERRQKITELTETACLENDSSDESEAEVNRMELLEENRKLKDPVLCKICLDKIATIITLPCGHMSSCSQCISALSTCAICRARIKGTVRALMVV